MPGKSFIPMEMETREALLANGAKPKAVAMTAKVMIARNDIIIAS